MTPFRPVLLIAGWAICGFAADGPALVPPRSGEDAVSRQRQSVAAMEPALEAQRQAIRRQLGTAPRFFLLPPPPRSGTHFEPAASCDPLPSSEIDSLVEEAAKREDVDPGLLRGVAQQESAFRPCAVSEKGAVGLMQLMPATATGLGVRDPFDPQENLDGGARFLKQLLNLYSGDVGLALGAYNAGPSKVGEAGGIPPLPETVDYVRKVMTLLPPRP